MCGIYAGTQSSPLARLHIYTYIYIYIYIHTHIYVIGFLHSLASFRPCVYASLLFVGLVDGEYRHGSWIRRGSWLRALCFLASATNSTSNRRRIHLGRKPQIKEQLLREREK